MLHLELDLAELLLLAPAEESPSPISISGLSPAERFVEGLCRAVGALAGCIVPPDGDEAADPGRPIGLVARSAAARTALHALLERECHIAQRGYGWIRADDVPDHCGLGIGMPVAGQTGPGQAGSGLNGVGLAGPGQGGHLMLVFARDHLDDESTLAQILSLAPGLGVMAGAMQVTVAGLEACERRHAALAAVLQQSECGIVVVAADQSVLFANPAARAILDASDGLDLRRNRLRPTRYQDAIRFHAALDTVIAPPRHAALPGKQPQRPRGAMLLLERPGPDRPLIAVIAPAGCDAKHTIDSNSNAGYETGHDQQAAAIVRLMRPEISVAHGLEPICQLHGLSPVETQLVACLTRGLTLGEAALQMRIKPDTARTYLKQVFVKTDTHRQTDLLQLVLRYQRAVSGNIRFDAL